MKQEGVRTCNLKTASPVPPDSSAETTGMVFSGGVLIELVRDPGTSGLGLIKVTGEGLTAGKQITHKGGLYVPPRNPPHIFGDVILPTTMCKTAISTEVVCSELRELYGNRVDEAGAWVMSTIILATWALDWLSAAPALVITGPGREALELLKAVAGACRRGLLLGQLSRPAFRLLPMGLHPTLVVGSLDRAAHRVLCNSTVRGLPILQGGRLIDPFCVSIIYAASPYIPPPGDDRYRIAVSPESPPRYRSEKQLRDIVSHFQPMLLRFRADLAARLSASERAPERSGPQGRAQELLGALFGDSPKLQARVGPLLAAQEDALQESQYSSVTRVVIEALLALLHQGLAEIMVGDVAKNASAILLQRGENYDLEPRAVGSILDDLGIDRGERKAKGIPLRFSQQVAREVHELARGYRVPNRHVGCGLCADVFSKQ